MSGDQKTILFVGGGSVGHIAPSVAVWRELSTMMPQAKAIFVCDDNGKDAEYLHSEHLEARPLMVPRHLSISYVLRMLHAFRAARTLLREIQPNVIFSKGGYVSVPVCLAARNLKIPYILHESDSVSGRANALLQKNACAICEGFPKQSAPITNHQNTNHYFTGNPIRPEVTKGKKEEGLKITGFDGIKPVLLVAGGSQGALAINKMIEQGATALLQDWNIVHLTGPGKPSSVQAEGYWAREFVTQELPHLYAITSLAVSRAGAGTIGELAANSIPTILIPLRGVGHDHQEINARTLESLGGCTVVEQNGGTEKLLQSIHDIASEKTKWMAMGKQMHEIMHKPDAAGQIARIVMQCLEGKGMHG